MTMGLVTKVQRLRKERDRRRELLAPPTSRSLPESLLEFVPALTPKYDPPHHLLPAIDLLERTVTEGGQRFIVSLPPRHGKTETVLHYIAWLLRQRPDWTVGYVSYAGTQAESKALKAQRLSESAGVIADPKMQNRSEWRTREGGGILATGIGGPLTGQGVNVLIVDDPVKNREEADSLTVREAHWGWWDDVAETRLEPGASVVIVMTRWHEDDLAGRLIANRPGEYTIVRIPAIADGLDALGLVAALDPRGRALGGPLWPERYALDALEKVRSDKPHTFTALYQGLPRSREERLFQPATYYETAPNAFVRAGGLDLAYSKDRRANHSAIVVMARVGSFYYVAHAERWRTEISDTLDRLERLQRQWRCTFRLEANGPQKAVAHTVAARGIRTEEFIPVSDKFARWQDYVEAWNAGRVLLPDPDVFPETRAWVETFLTEHYAVSGVNDPSDDLVDAASVAFGSRVWRQFDKNATDDDLDDDGPPKIKRIGGY